MRRALRRSQVLNFFRKLQPCLVGMEACGSAHYWAQEIQALGHTVRLMPPVYVKAYLKRNKTDAADAEAICEAVTRPTMRYVPVKTRDEQSAGMVLKARDLLIRQRTQTINALRAHLAELGIVRATGLVVIMSLAAIVRDNNEKRRERSTPDDHSRRRSDYRRDGSSSCTRSHRFPNRARFCCLDWFNPTYAFPRRQRADRVDLKAW